MATHQPDAQRDKAEPGLHRNNVRSSSRMRMVIALTIIIPFLNVIPNLSSPPIFPSFKLAFSKLLENSLLSNDRQKPPLDSCDTSTEPCYKYPSSKLLEIFLSILVHQHIPLSNSWKFSFRATIKNPFDSCDRAPA